MKLNWLKCQRDVWCSFQRVDLNGIRTEGVYVIWKPGNPSRVIRVGQGIIADRLSAHRIDPQITQYGNDLLVTWASVAAAYRDGVELYLAQRYSPLVGDRFPVAVPVPVNLPE